MHIPFENTATVSITQHIGLVPILVRSIYIMHFEVDLSLTATLISFNDNSLDGLHKVVHLGSSSLIIGQSLKMP